MSSPEQNMSSIDLDTTVVRAEHILASPVEQSLVMMDVEGGDYYSLDEIGAAIWERLAEPLPVRSLCEQLIAAYEVAPDTCQQDVLAFLGELIEVGMVARVD